MEPPARKKRKRYLHDGQVFDVPLSTRRYRLRHMSQPTVPGNASNAAEPDLSCSFDASPQLSEDEVGVSSAGRQTDNTCPATDEDTDSVPSDPVPPIDVAQALATALREYGTATLPGSTTTKAGAIVMILSFVVTHGLPWDTVDSLLRLIEALFGFEGDMLPRSKYLLRKLWNPTVHTAVTRHYYCNICGSQLEELRSDTVRCEACQADMKVSLLNDAGCFFSILNIKQQLGQTIAKCKDVLFSQMEKIEQGLQSESVSDITSGALYKSLRQSGKINHKDFTLTFNTDGSPVYKSSKASVWPIQFTINELPPVVRRQTPVLAGLWFGHKHPDMMVFMEKFVEALQAVGIVGWQYGTETVRSKVHAICCSVDVPARAAVTNQTQFNGRFGCCWCLTCAEHIEGAPRYIQTDFVLRTEEGVLRDMKLALELNMPVNGIKGPSPLINLDFFNPVLSQAVDYMHCVLLGVARQLTEFWLDSANSQEPFYIGAPSTLAKLDKRLLSICPPHCFTRLPRSLADRCFWKASEWKNWLLYYSLPTVLGVLPPRFWRHVSMLAEAIFTLLKSEISPTDLQRAGHLLQSFVSRAASLYGTRFMTFNVHQLRHLTSSVEHLGPLWANSAFPFETGNGKLTKMSAACLLSCEAENRVVSIHDRVIGVYQGDDIVKITGSNDSERDMTQLWTRIRRVSVKRENIPL
ncbi:hypothetical protein HPB49_017958 [Dermacentor silvarum]|uniref:Uncharacterized protein n=1 Tax=Dermacentor silvarum TaxID=543639 RepID=A0ACB8E188_DERSI|nr:hypothetical protein HPB49_017958 [Dermacentor silvarum]